MLRIRSTLAVPVPGSLWEKNWPSSIRLVCASAELFRRVQLTKGLSPAFWRSTFVIRKISDSQPRASKLAVGASVVVVVVVVDVVAGLRIQTFFLPIDTHTKIRTFPLTLEELIAPTFGHLSPELDAKVVVVETKETNNEQIKVRLNTDTSKHYYPLTRTI